MSLGSEERENLTLYRDPEHTEKAVRSETYFDRFRIGITITQLFGMANAVHISLVLDYPLSAFPNFDPPVSTGDPANCSGKA